MLCIFTIIPPFLFKGATPYQVTNVQQAIQQVQQVQQVRSSSQAEEGVIDIDKI
jgi:hypothetical protein